MTIPEKIADVTKDSPAQRTFLAKVGDGEPIFILRARDALAMGAISAWLDAARYEGVNADKIAAAKAHQEMFRLWQQTHATKLPD